MRCDAWIHEVPDDDAGSDAGQASKRSSQLLGVSRDMNGIWTWGGEEEGGMVYHLLHRLPVFRSLSEGPMMVILRRVDRRGFVSISLLSTQSPRKPE